MEIREKNRSLPQFFFSRANLLCHDGGLPKVRERVMEYLPYLAPNDKICDLSCSLLLYCHP